MNLARFDLISIRLAVACAQSGSLTAAAREAHIALAAASRRIRELEYALGDVLFKRCARGLEPTSAGRIFVKYGLALLQTMDQLGDELADRRLGLSHRVRLCASSAAISQFLPTLLARYDKLAPHVRVDLEEQISEGVVTALRDGRADVGVFVDGADSSGLDAQLFREDELVLVLPAAHALAEGRSALAFEELLGEDWISLNNGAAMLQAQQQAALTAGRPLRLRMQVRSFDVVCHLVASGLGLAILPREAALPLISTMNLKWRALSNSWARRRMLVATRTGPSEAGVQALVRFLVDPSQKANVHSSNKQ